MLSEKQTVITSTIATDELFQRKLLREFEREAHSNSPESESCFGKMEAFWDGFGG